MCRASLSPWYINGGIKPKDENDEPVFVGRFNVGRFLPHYIVIYNCKPREHKHLWCTFNDLVNVGNDV